MEINGVRTSNPVNQPGKRAIFANQSPGVAPWVMNKQAQIIISEAYMNELCQGVCIF